MTGVVVTAHRSGYGFLRPVDGGPDIYFVALDAPGVDWPIAAGTAVEFDVVRHYRGKQRAIHLKVLQGAPTRIAAGRVVILLNGAGFIETPSGLRVPFREIGGLHVGAAVQFTLVGGVGHHRAARDVRVIG